MVATFLVWVVIESVTSSNFISALLHTLVIGILVRKFVFGDLVLCAQIVLRVAVVARFVFFCLAQIVRISMISRVGFILETEMPAACSLACFAVHNNSKYFAWSLIKIA